MSSGNIQNIKCGWTGCSHKFGSEVDMNMHVMMNHMIILEHGKFVLEKPVISRKRVREEEVRELEVPKIEEEEEVIPPKEKEAIPPPRPVENAAPLHTEATQLSAKVKIEALFQNQYSDFSNGKMREECRREMPKAPAKIPHDMHPALVQSFYPNDWKRLLADREAEGIPIRPDIDIPTRSPQEEMDYRNVNEWGEEDSDDSLQNGVDQAQLGVQEQMDFSGNDIIPLSITVVEIIERLKPMKQLGFIRPQRSVYCLICLKYVKSFHECNWKHTPNEDRIAGMWCRNYGGQRPSGKNQLMKQLLELKSWIQQEEADEEQAAKNNAE